MDSQVQNSKFRNAVSIIGPVYFDKVMHSNTLKSTLLVHPYTPVKLNLLNIVIHVGLCVVIVLLSIMLLHYIAHP